MTGAKVLISLVQRHGKYLFLHLDMFKHFAYKVFFTAKPLRSCCRITFDFVEYNSADAENNKKAFQ